MKKIILFFALLTVTLLAQTNFHQQKTTIKGFENGLAIITNPQNLSIGVSGVILREFDSQHKTIIAKATVVKKDANYLYLKFKKFDGVKQDVLPTYDIVPKVGDEVILNYHYNKALAIAPNKKTYQFIITKYNYFDWLHPDIFAATLALNFNPKPTKKDFRNECSEDGIGLLLFAIDDKLNFVDCQSFKVIKSEYIQPTNEFLKPFYTRINSVKSRFGGLFGGSGIKDYNSYYKKLLAGK